jgi:hypothetical protein
MADAVTDTSAARRQAVGALPVARGELGELSGIRVPMVDGGRYVEPTGAQLVCTRGRR